MSSRAPSIGRIVVYREQAAGEDPETQPGPDYPAIITRICDPGPGAADVADLTVFSPYVSAYVVHDVPRSGASPMAATLGDEPAPDTWRWPDLLPAS